MWPLGRFGVSTLKLIVFPSAEGTVSRGSASNVPVDLSDVGPNFYPRRSPTGVHERRAHAGRSRLCQYVWLSLYLRIRVIFACVPAEARSRPSLRQKVVSRGSTSNVPNYLHGLSCTSASTSTGAVLRPRFASIVRTQGALARRALAHVNNYGCRLDKLGTRAGRVNNYGCRLDKPSALGDRRHEVGPKSATFTAPTAPRYAPRGRAPRQNPRAPRRRARKREKAPRRTPSHRICREAYSPAAARASAARSVDGDTESSAFMSSFSYAARPVPAGSRRPINTFSLRPRR